MTINEIKKNVAEVQEHIYKICNLKVAKDEDGNNVINFLIMEAGTEKVEYFTQPNEEAFRDFASENGYYTDGTYDVAKISERCKLVLVYADGELNESYFEVN
ncbi:MAG: hypothetical protein ACI39Q_07685 [Wujia sp.]